MVGIAFTAQNCAVVMATVAYGTALATIQQDLGIDRATASLGTGVMLLALGILSPFVGNLLQRFPVRDAMSIGALLNIAGYVIVAQARDFTLVLAAFALLIGPGACLMGPVPVTTLVSRWFDRDRGKALGIANMPLFLLFVPPIVAFLILEGGRQALFLSMAAVFVVLLPVLRLVRERPEEPASVVQDKASASDVQHVLSNGQLLRDGRFWSLNLAIGVLTGSGAAFVTHAVPLATSKGIAFGSAASVMSSYGLGTLLGALVFGWLIDRIGALAALVTGSAILTALWFGLFSFDDLGPLLAVSGVMGATMGSVVAMHGATVAFLFGSASVGRAMGLSYFLKIPFLFGSAPLLGHLFDLHGDYDLATIVSACAVGLSTLVFLMLALYVRRAGRPAGS